MWFPQLTPDIGWNICLQRSPDIGGNIYLQGGIYMISPSYTWHRGKYIYLQGVYMISPYLTPDIGGNIYLQGGIYVVSPSYTWHRGKYIFTGGIYICFPYLSIRYIYVYLRYPRRLEVLKVKPEKYLIKLILIKVWARLQWSTTYEEFQVYISFIGRYDLKGL